MILNNTVPDVILSGDFEETEFSIDEASNYIVFDMLRSKIYKNNIGAICREVACNARDAQREKGDYTTPIEIEISDNRNNFFYHDGLNIIFRDKGIGISPENASNIYVKYGASTKRNSNNMTGGFGLGSKTPFSYSDAFTVRTIYNNIEYVYSIYIDVTKKGKMALLFKEEKISENLTEIIIPLKEADLYRFKSEVIKNTYFWKVRPKLINFNMDYQKIDSNIDIKKENEYFVLNKTSFIESNINTIIDGIYYPIDSKIIGYDFNNLYQAIFLIFENGELNISANRETLQYDNNTISLIKNKLESFFDIIKKDYINEINKSENLLKAQIIFNRAYKENNFFEILTQKNKFYFDIKDPKNKLIERIELNNFKDWKPKTFNIYHYKNGFNRQDAILINNIFKNEININNYYYISQNDIILHKSKTSLPINRTLYNNDKEFILIIDLKLNEYNWGSSTKQDFDNANNIEKQFLQKLGLNILDYWQVIPSKLPTEQKAKKEEVTLKIFEGHSFRKKDYNFKNGYFENLNNNVFFYYIEKENELNNELKNRLQDLSGIFYSIDKKSCIVISTKLKQRYFKKYINFKQFIIDNNKQINDLINKQKNIANINLYNRFKKDSVLDIYKNSFKELEKLEKMEDINIYSFFSIIKENNIKFDVDYKDYTEIFTKLFSFYPNLKEINESYVNEKYREIYINLVNDINKLNIELQEFKNEKNKYNKFIN